MRWGLPVLPVMVFDEEYLLVLTSTHEPFFIFSLPPPAAEESERAALVGAWHHYTR